MEFEQIYNAYFKSVYRYIWKLSGDVPLYLENIVSEDTAVFVKEHLENCLDCAAEFEGLQSGVQIDAEETPQREHDAEVITTVKKKISKRTVRIVAGVCLVFVGLLIAIVLYTSISHPVGKDDISLSIETGGGYFSIIMETAAGKTIYFNSKTEEVLNSQNEVIGSKIILYNLKCRNGFSQDAGSMSWDCPEDRYLELVVELEDGTL